MQRRARTLDLPVGGAFGDELVIRYRVLDRAEWDKYAVLLTPNLQTGADNLPPMSVLNVAHDGRRLRDRALRRRGLAACGSTGGSPSCIGHPLAEGMSYDDLGVVEVVEALFPSPMAVTTHAGRLVTWMQDPSDPGGAEGEG